MYYIDFDNTLYETGLLTKDVLSELSKTIAKEKNLIENDILQDLQNSFNSTVDNFLSLGEKFSIKYDIDYEILKSTILNVIVKNGKKYVFPDALEFLKKLKEKNEPVCILTYVSQSKNLHQQSLKLLGSGILEYVTEVYSTTRLKYTLELDYKNNTFIDDSPRDIEGLFNSGATKIIRVKKPNNEKRTSKELNLPIQIKTITSFEEL